MNYSILFKRFIQILFIALACCFVVIILAQSMLKERLYSSFLQTKKNELILLVQVGANDILTGNFKNFRQRMAGAKEIGVFQSYLIDEEKIGIVDRYPELSTENITKIDLIKVDIPIYFTGASDPWGQIHFYINDDQLKSPVEAFNKFSFITALLVVFIVCAGFLLYFVSIDKWTKEFRKSFEAIISKTLPVNIGIRNPWYHSVMSFQDLQKEVETKENELITLREQSILSNIASQVSHDIRSPLTALNMVFSVLKDVPEEHRVMLRSAVGRINDIANSLLDKSKNVKLSSNPVDDTKLVNIVAVENKNNIKVCLLQPLVDSIVSEKRIQWRDKIGVQIESDYSEVYGAFINCNTTELARVLSNLINNSIEAFSDFKGRITVAIRGYSNSIYLSVSDNGKGMSKELLAKVGREKISFGKEGTESGTGLGVYHARQTIESFGGKFEIESREGLGTRITMSFSRADSPNWFVPELQLAKNAIVVTLDDDISIHHVWQRKFENSGLNSGTFKHLQFTSAVEFDSWFKASNLGYTNDLVYYFFDYELLNQMTNGIEVIEKHNLNLNTFLVTSRFEEIQILQKLGELNVKLIPKPMVEFLPINIL